MGSMWQPVAGASGLELEARLVEANRRLGELNRALSAVNREVVWLNGMVWDMYKRLEGQEPGKGRSV